jgi:hypothetical protein
LQIELLHRWVRFSAQPTHLQSTLYHLEHPPRDRRDPTLEANGVMAESCSNRWPMKQIAAATYLGAHQSYLADRGLESAEADADISAGGNARSVKCACTLAGHSLAGSPQWT